MLKLHILKQIKAAINRLETKPKMSRPKIQKIKDADQFDGITNEIKAAFDV